MPPPSGGFRLESVTVVRDGRTLLRVPGLHLPPGRTTALVGPSGAGKSTLLRLLAGLDAPSSGAVLSAGPAGTPLVPGEVVMVFQRPVLLRGTVRENVEIPLRLRGERDTSGRVERLLERLDLAGRAGQSVRSLSGGEYQRVALARALVLAPVALLLDEPTANLDPETVSRIEALVRETQEEQGTTVVWVTHNPQQARRVADTVLLLVEGEVVEHAPTDHFFSEAAHPRTQDFLAGRMVW